MLVAEAGQQLLDRPPEDSGETMRELADSIQGVFAEKPARPEEVRMAIARGCRNAAMGAIAFEGALLTLGRIQDGSLQQNVSVRQEGPVDESTHEFWQAVTGFEPDDMHLLGTLYTETNADFSAAVAVTDEERPDITDLWRSHHDVVNTSTTELLEVIAATPDERTARDKYLFDWHNGGAPFTTSAHERAAATNRPTVKVAFNLLVTEQRDTNNTLTGSQLAAAFRDNLDRAAGLAGGKHTVVTRKLTPACAPHEAASPLTVLDDNGHYDLGPFKSANHVRAPGDCPGYDLYMPGIQSPPREGQLAIIQWLRAHTNHGEISSWNPIDRIRAAEVSLFAAAAIAETLWPDKKPFQPTGSITIK